MRRLLFTVLLVLTCVPLVSAQNGGIDPEALIEQILRVDSAQRAEVKTLVVDAVTREGKYEDDGSFKEEKRFEKEIYMKFLPDTTLLAEKYLAYWDKDKRKSDKDLAKAAKERKEKKKKRKSGDASMDMYKPFTPEFRPEYDIQYVGVTEDPIDGYICHHFSVHAHESDQLRINGEYYFDAESFHLVRVDFSPAKLIKKMMFKLKELQMSLRFAPTEDGYWLPAHFNIRGKGKAALFIGVKFAAQETYSNARINVDIDEAMFEESDDD